MRNDVKHIFICLFAICVFLLKHLFKVFGPFSNWIVCFLLLSFKVLCIFLDNSSLSDVSFVDVFSQSMTHLLIFSTVFFSEQFLKMLMKPSLLYHSWITPLVFYLKSHCYAQGHLDFILCYLLGVFSFCVLHLDLGSILYGFLQWIQGLCLYIYIFT